MTGLRERIEAMPPGSLIPRDWLLEQLDAEPESVDEPAVVVDLEPSWRERLWTCPADTRLGVRELAEALGRPRGWIYRRTSVRAAAANGRHGRLDMIPHTRLGGELVFRAGDVRDWLRAHEARGAA